MAPRGKDGGRDSQGVWDGRRHTAVFNMGTSKDLLDSTGNSAQYSVITLWSPGGKKGGRDSQGVWDGRGHTAAFKIHSHLLTPGQAL